jgi:hypothetical protein
VSTVDLKRDIVSSLPKEDERPIPIGSFHGLIAMDNHRRDGRTKDLRDCRKRTAVVGGEMCLQWEGEKLVRVRMLPVAK